MHIDITRAWETIQGWINDFFALLPNIIAAILAFFLIYLIGKSLRRVITNLTAKHQRSRNVGLVVGRLTMGFVSVVGFFIALTIVMPSITAAQLVGALGISSIAIGFAFKDILQNFLAGLLILLTQPFRIGDQIIVNNFEGIVLNIETRATTIRTYDNSKVVIPNADMFTLSVRVNTAFDKRRSEYDFSIRYTDDIDKTKEAILNVMKNTEGVLTTPPPDVLTVEMNESIVKIRGRWWIAVPATDWLKVREQIMSNVKKEIDKQRSSEEEKA